MTPRPIRTGAARRRPSRSVPFREEHRHVDIDRIARSRARVEAFRRYLAESGLRGEAHAAANILAELDEVLGSIGSVAA